MKKEPGPLSRIDIPIRCALTGFPVLMYVIDGFDFSHLKTISYSKHPYRGFPRNSSNPSSQAYTNFNTSSDRLKILAVRVLVIVLTESDLMAQ